MSGASQRNLGQQASDVDELEFPHPYAAVDVVLLTVRAARIGAMITKRHEEPRGWVLPGAFVQLDEDVDQTAARVTHDKLGLAAVPQFIALRPFGTVTRDPRRRVISLPHLALVDSDRLQPARRTMPQDVTFADVQLERSGVTTTVDSQDCQLMFDHPEILRQSIYEVRRRVQLDDPEIHSQLLPETFSLRQLQEIHEAILGEPVNRDSFRRRVLTSGRLERTDVKEADVEHRPATLYRWRS